MFGQLKSQIRCRNCKNISNLFEPFSSLSLPIPKEGKTKLSVVYFPNSLDNNQVVKRFKVGFNNFDSVVDVKKKIQSLVGTDQNIAIYNLTDKNLLQKEIEDDKKVNKIEHERLIAYEYNNDILPSTIAVHAFITVEEASMFGRSKYDYLWEPKIFFFDNTQSWTQLRKTIFRYFFPYINLPQNFKDLYSQAEDKEDCINQIYDDFYNNSNYGVQNNFIFEYEIERNLYYNHISYRVFEESEDSLVSFMSKLNKSPFFYMKIHFPKTSKMNLKAFKYREDYGKLNTTISLSNCFEQFWKEELLRDENQYYCKKWCKHQDAYKKMDLYQNDLF